MCQSATAIRPFVRGLGGKHLGTDLSLTMQGPRQWDNAHMETNQNASTETSGTINPHYGDLPIFLVGMMGAGKTTIGRGLARAMARDFVDLDQELEARCGVRVPVIFEIEGEAGFRRRESQVLEDCTRRRGVVLATGGGAVISQENRQYLSGRGLVVYLRASVEDLYRRTCRDQNRPLLATADPRGRLTDLLQQREPLYQEVADLVIETGGVQVSRVVDTLLRTLSTSEKFQCMS